MYADLNSLKIQEGSMKFPFSKSLLKASINYWNNDAYSIFDASCDEN